MWFTKSFLRRQLHGVKGGSQSLEFDPSLFPPLAVPTITPQSPTRTHTHTPVTPTPLIIASEEAREWGICYFFQAFFIYLDQVFPCTLFFCKLLFDPRCMSKWPCEVDIRFFLGA